MIEYMRMKYAFGICFLFLICCDLNTSTNPGFSKKKFFKIKVGDSMEQVIYLLGPPAIINDRSHAASELKRKMGIEEFMKQYPKGLENSDALELRYSTLKQIWCVHIDAQRKVTKVNVEPWS